MRNRFVFIVLVPVLVVCIVTVLFIDSWVESGLEYAGEKIVKARVEIDGLGVTLFPVGLSWDRLQVADPTDTRKNLFETGGVKFEMDAGQLLRAKFIIDTVRVEGFVLGTDRMTDGALRVQPRMSIDRPEAAGEPLSAQAQKAFGPGESAMPVFDLGRLRRELNLDSLTNPANLETYRVVESLKGQLEASGAEWAATVEDIRATKDRISSIAAQARSIDVGVINSVESAQKALSTAQSSYESTRGILQTLDERRASLTASVNGFSSDLRTIDEAARKDFERVVSAAKLPDVSMRGLARLVLGGEILDQATEYLGYVDLARTTIPKYTPKPDPDQPRRSEGVTVSFPDERSFPKFWVREVLLSGGTDSLRSQNYFYATGVIKNITNDQRLTGEPLSFDLEARNGNRTTATIRASFDRRADEPHDTYTVDVSGIPVGDMALGSAAFLPSTISDAVAHAHVSLDVPGNRLESSAKISFASLSITFDRDPTNAVERLTRDVLKSVRAFFVNLRIWRRATGSLDVAFETDLDDQLSSRARSVIGAEVARIRDDIRRRVDAQIAQKRREIQRLYDRERSEVLSQMAALEKEVREQLSVVEAKKKELEQRLEQEKKRAEDALKKKAGDALRGIFKKN